MENLSLSAFFLLTTTAYMSYILLLVIYRLYLHPLARFPGPKLAAATSWYDFYFDVIKRGSFLFEIERMHQKYGPIIRITPHELHINDPTFYTSLYGSATRKRDKYHRAVNIGVALSGLSTVGHEHHRIRRAALNPFFSKKAVMDLEPLIHEKISYLAARFKESSERGDVIRADAAYTAYTADLISRYAFARDDNLISAPDFQLGWKVAITSSLEAIPLLRHFPLLYKLMSSLPASWMEKVNPNMKILQAESDKVCTQIRPILNRTESAEEIENASHRSIFHDLRDGELPAGEKTFNRLRDEAETLTAAGTESTANTLAHITFHLLSNPDILTRLREELKTVLPTPTSTATWSQLEQLPYLSAVISEGLRMATGVSTRLPRIAVDELLVYKQWTIPAGTPVSQSNHLILRSPTIFPSPSKYDPNRWMTKDGQCNRDLATYKVNFGKGPRSCLGINLAYAELFITVATIFRRFEMRLFETREEDVVMAHDFFIPVPRMGSKGLRVLVEGEVRDMLG